MELRIKKLTDSAVLPVRGSKEAAGLDICLDQDILIVDPGKRVLAPTGLAMAFEPGYYARLAPRSGHAVKHGIDLLAGVVDSDYRGEVKVALFNTGEKRVIFHRGERIAQLILEKIALPEVREVDDLDGTDRDTGGFGSTG